jgi:AmmeMemoRadiSam system protein B
VSRLAVGVAAVLVAVAGPAGCGRAARVAIAGTYPRDARMWGLLTAPSERLSLPGRPVAAVAPHHLIDGVELGAFHRALAEAGPASVVVVVGPDHFARDGADVTVGDRLRFDTPFGPLLPDAALVVGLRAVPGVVTRDGAFPREHSIHAHAPYLARFAPGARFLPVLVRPGAAAATLDAVAEALHRLLPPDALVLASVDFSHFQPAPWAAFHDEATWASLAGFELDRLPDCELDSPESLRVAMGYAALRGARRATKVLHTNSQERRSVLLPDSTSHLYVTFTAGGAAPEPSISVLVTGDLPASAGLGLLDRWRWRGADAPPGDPRLDRIRGEEDRFFAGADANLFRLEPGRREERVIHGLRAAFAAVALGAVHDPAAEVARLRAGADCLFVLAWADDPAGQAQRARALVDAGADVVVGRGFGPAVPAELRANRLLALSLGAFLAFAPGAAPERGEVLGATCGPDGVRARSLPILVEGGGPRLDLDALREALGYGLPPPAALE